jgi:hypothetical protein
MHKNKFSVPRQVSPDDLSLSHEKLSMMHDNLRLASDTIGALKSERDRLAQMIRSPEAPNDLKSNQKLKDSLKKRALKDELVSLRTLAIQKDRTIESLHRKLKDFRNSQGEVQVIRESYSKLMFDVGKKEKNIVELEERIKELENLEENYKNIVKVNENLKLEIKNLNGKMQDQSKIEWKDVFEIINSLFSEHFICNKGAEIGKNDLEVFIQRMKIVRNVLNDYQRPPDIQKSTKNEVKELEKINKKLKKELDLISKAGTDSNTFFEIQETAVDLIEMVHSSVSLHSMFKKSFICSKSLHKLIDRHMFDEALLRTLKFSMILMQDLSFSCSKEPVSLDYPRPILKATPKSGKSCSKKFSFVEDPAHDELSKSNCWTQTDSRNHPPSKPSESFKSQKSDSQIKNRSIQVPGAPVQNLKSHLKPSNSQNFSKLLDENHQILSIIDKQNSRLAKINTQISQLVPNASSKDSSFVVDTSESSSPEVRSFYRLPLNKRTAWDEEESIVVHSDKNMKKKSKGCQMNSLTDSIQLRSPPKAHPPEEQPKLESKHLRSESLRDMLNDFEDDPRQIIDFPRKEKKRSAWDLTAVKVPPLIEKKKVKRISPNERKVARKRSKSPEVNSDRFNEYTRPLFRGEGIWNGVGEFFSSITEENKTTE